jgi:Na+-translocating ferredoxin:NAD+ oxidoreductase RnfG subunit
MDSGYLVDHVSAQLQAILARKEEEKRQALLDSITKQNADTNRMQAESNEKWRTGQTKREEAVANKEWLNDLSQGQDLSDADVSRMNEAGYGGLVKKTQETKPFDEQPNGFINEGPIQISKNTYAGSPQEQKETKDSEALSNLLKADPEFTKKPYLQQWLTLQQLGIKVDPSKLRDPNSEMQDIVRVGRDGTMKTIGQAKKSAHIVNEPAPTGVGSESYDLIVSGDEKNPTYQRFGRKSGAISDIPVKGAGEAPTGPMRKVGTAIPQPPKPVEEAWRKGLPAIQRAVEARNKAKGLKSDQMAGLDANIAATRAAVVNQLPNTSDDFKRQLTQIVTHPVMSTYPMDKLITGMNAKRTASGYPAFTPEEENIIKTVLPQILGHN